jgi:hypothetical protein
LKTLAALTLIAGALLLGATPARVSATVHFAPKGLIPHLRANATAPTATLQASSPNCHGSSCTSYEDAINTYFQDVAHDSGTMTNVYSAATQYSGIQYQETFGGSYVDTNPYPTSNNCHDNYDTYCLTDAQLRAAIQRDITANAANGWPSGGTTNLFFIFTPSNVGICSDATLSQCSTNAFCAYHDYISGGSGIVYAVQPYNATIPTGGCDQGQYPNGNDADATINTVSHEQNEAITDANTMNGWYAANGNENGDLCAWTFGTTSGSPGAEFNQTINGHHYWLQEEYSNAAIVGGGCVQFLNGPANGPSLSQDGIGPLVPHGSSVMTTNTVYAIYWVPTAGSAPTNSAPPIVSGVAAVGTTLSTTSGSWLGSPTSYAYQWQSCSSTGTSCADISGATGTTYQLAAADAGHEIRSEVSAHNAGGSSSYVASTPTEPAVPLPAINVAPVVSGISAVGKTLSTTQGAWNTPVTYAYQWLRCGADGTSCVSISDATSATYKVVSADRGHTLEARVAATNAAGTTYAASPATGTVIAVPAASRLPQISGRPKVGKRLSVSLAAWTDTPSSLEYQWLRCNGTGGSCTRIKGATKSAYRLTKRDAKHRLRVKVTAANEAGSSSFTSSTTHIVKR